MLLYRKTKQNVPPSPPAEHVGISIIVCCLNEKENLTNHLPTLLNQDYEKFEVLIVDDGSTDLTSTYIEKLQLEHQHLKYLYLDPNDKIGKGKKYALSQGIQHSTYDWLALTDADCRVVSQHWLTRLAQTQANKKLIGLGFGGYEYRNCFLNKVIQFETILTYIQYSTLAIFGHPYMGVGRNLFYSKTAYNNSPGLSAIFDKTSGDDDLLINSMITNQNYHLVTSPDSFTISTSPTSWKSYFKQKTRHYSVGTCYKTSTLLLLGSWSSSFVFSNIFLIFIVNYFVELPLFLKSICIFKETSIFLGIFLLSKHAKNRLRTLDIIVLQLFWFIYLFTFSIALSKRNATKW